MNCDVDNRDIHVSVEPCPTRRAADLLLVRTRSITIGISLSKTCGITCGEFALRGLSVTVRVGRRPVSCGFHACFRRGKLTVPIRVFRRPCCGNPGVMFSSAELSISRSEEHTSELQSLMRISYAVFCLKKKKQKTHD